MFLKPQRRKGEIDLFGCLLLCLSNRFFSPLLLTLFKCERESQNTEHGLNKKKANFHFLYKSYSFRLSDQTKQDTLDYNDRFENTREHNNYEKMMMKKSPVLIMEKSN